MAKHPVVHPVDRLPAGHELGGLKPKVRNRDDLSLALRVIAWITSRRDTVQAALEQKIGLLREQAKGDMQLEVDGRALTFDMREAALREAVKKYVLHKKADIFPEGNKTARFPSGTVALKDKPPSLQFDDGVSKKSIVLQLCEQHGLMAKAAAWLKRLRLLPWLKLTWDLDVAGIGRAIKAEQIDTAELAELGLRWEGEENVVITPADYAAAADGPVEDSRQRKASA